MVEVQALERPSDTLRQDLTPDQHSHGDHSFQDRQPWALTYLDPPKEGGAVAIPQTSRGHSTEGPIG